MSEEEKSLPEQGAAEAPVKRKKRGKMKRLVTRGRVYVQATYNNTIITVTDEKGDVIAWQSAGGVGFKGPKKSTPYAASIIIRKLLEKIKDVGLKQVDVYIKGVGSGRESAVRSIAQQGITITSIKDVTPMPHNGTRAPKPRRI